eukprot:40096-Pyramimonas_sp.AAC.1
MAEKWLQAARRIKAPAGKQLLLQRRATASSTLRLTPLEAPATPVKAASAATTAAPTPQASPPQAIS